MRWVVAAVVVALVAVVGVNVLLLDYSGARHDPVGRLSPVANLTTQTVQTRPLPPAPVHDRGRTDGASSDD
jgi:hypothetical protein